MIQHILSVLLLSAYAWFGHFLYLQNHWLILPYVAATLVLAWFLQSDGERDIWRKSVRRWAGYRGDAS